jgi:hypothetical protein
MSLDRILLMYLKKVILSLFISCTFLNVKSQDQIVPGVIINHSPASTGIYIGCPGIAKIGDGVYLAKHSEFGPGSSEWESAVSHIYRSDDSGESWRRISTINGLFWASIFTLNNSIYLFGTDKHHGNLVIMRSDDEGITWTVPTNENSGLLLQGQYHTAPVPVVIHNGRIWRAVENASGAMTQSGGTWGGPFYRSFMMSAPVNSDLLERKSWTVSNSVKRDPDWLNGLTRAWLEGNAVLSPLGNMLCILRVNFLREPGIASGDTAAIVHVSKNGKKATFKADRDFINLPGGDKKFTIRYDSISKKYWALTNWVPPHLSGQTHSDLIRNTLILICSDDLYTWQKRAVILYHPDRINHGFQYVDWLFEGDDIIAVSRTAYEDEAGGANSAHNANYLTFHRIENFRTFQEVDINKTIKDFNADKF